MLRSRIHLIGGGPGTLHSLRRHLAALVPSAVPARGARKPLVAYVGAASGDNAEFQRMIAVEIAAAGVRVQAVKLASPRAKTSAAKALLEGCDVVFMSGGDVDMGMNVLGERGLVPLFHDLARDGRPIIGISAGSMMLARAWVRFPEPGTRGRPTVFPCIGVAPVYVDAHAEEDRWAELRTLLRLLVASGETAPVGYGLTCDGGISVEPKSRRLQVVPFGTAAPRFIVRNGRVVRGPELALGSSDAVSARPPRRQARRS